MKLNKRNLKSNKAITLIALVITVIVLLILAGVAIATLTGDNGLLTKATTAKQKNEEAEIGEQIKLAYTEWQTAKYTGESKTAQEYMKEGLRVILKDDNLEVVEECTGVYVITTGGMDYTFTVSEGKIEAEISIGIRIKKSTAKEDSYVGCYADIDADGTVDGVIFVDLLTGSVRDLPTKWTNDNGGYTLPTDVTTNNVKNYYISKESHTWAGITKPVITPKGNGKKRFYIMQLEDFTVSEYIDLNNSENNYGPYTTFYWYCNAYSHMSPVITSNDFGKGNENTGKMIAKWNAAGTTEGYPDSPQNKRDIWKYIQTIYNNGEGWFIPSRAEWSAFANELGITPDNYSYQYGLKDMYWSSSQNREKWTSWYVVFNNGYMSEYNVLNSCWVRLVTQL